MSKIVEFVGAEVKRRGIKYTAIFHATGIPVDALSKSFSGKRKMGADELLQVCRFAGLDIGELAEAYDTSQAS